MRALLDWIDDRTGLGRGVRNLLDARVPGRVGWHRVCPAAIAFVFCVQVITGFFLWIYYSPSKQTAWESVYFLQYQVAGGWLLRAMHHWSAQVLLVLVGLYLIQMIVTGAYRAPRELVFWSAVLMAVVTLGLLLTGDLLAWDQNSVASTQVRVGFLELLPWVGSGFYKLAVGGPEFGQLTLPRFLALHIFCLSGSLLLLLLLHGLLVRRADATQTASTGRSAAFWPRQAALNARAMAVVMAVVLLLSLKHGLAGDQRGVELGSPADTSSSFAAARPEWAFLGLYQFARLFPGGRTEILPIFVIPGLLLVVALAMPWIARRRGGHWFNLTFTGVLLAGVVALSLLRVRMDLVDEKHQAALATEVQHAYRAVQLSRHLGIPATGALTLLRNDPKTQGPILFQTHCAACHDHVDADGNGIQAEEPSAPNLHGYATRKWIAGWLDLRTITGPNYFGNTKLRHADMVQNLEALYEDLAPDELKELKQDLAKVAAALSAQAGLAAEAETDKKDAAVLSRGHALIEELGCIDCHRFHDKGRLGTAPDLTGYGSREWTIAIIAHAAANRFYGDKNDGMPAYAPSAGDPATSILSDQQIGLLADWLRGQWYEE
jgi:ubiquinol-cytochrome c reductase cytochrome b subunit